MTGAGSGLGKSLAIKYSQSGSHVCLLGRTKTTLMNTASQLDGESSIYELDVTDKTNIEHVTESIIRVHGSIDCWVNNAGIGIFKPVIELTEEDVNRTIDTNLIGTIFCTQEVLKVMHRQKKGCFINIISNSGKVVKKMESVYSASKFGVRGFTEALAIECQDLNINILSAYMGNMITNLWRTTPSNEQRDSYMHPDRVAELIFESAKHQKDIQEENINVINHNIKKSLEINRKPIGE
ncbi:SDR family oxidoreductase [Alteribacillus bidgolensis]|uniref:SDR family oxidoreductase n=1 Tax=Alteribacillus bidgolensis TaxID=930129 RepID=UPI00267742B0|nr:SDR family oxidoreductase [Alteribacillus bidgolensis]